MALGVLFVLLAGYVGLSVYNGTKQLAASQQQSQKFANEFLADLSKDWRHQDVGDRLSSKLSQYMSSSAGTVLFQRSSKLGRLRQCPKLLRANHRLAGKVILSRTVLECSYEGGKAVWRITLAMNGETSRVVGLVLMSLDIGKSRPERA